MREFIKVQAGSIIGSAVDFFVTIVCTEIFHIWYLLSNAFGNGAGGLTQFIIGRQWIFHKGKSGVGIQFLKYCLFFFGNILLSAAGTYALTQYFHINYICSKLVCSILIGLSYNYFVQKYFVFS